MLKLLNTLILLFIWGNVSAHALERPEVEYKIFQFPRHMIPRIDGNPKDWDIVPDDYIIGIDEHVDTRQGAAVDKNNFDLKIKVGWVKDINRIYFLYEAYDDYWNIDDPGRHSELLELVVDGDLSGGRFLARDHPAGEMLTRLEKYFTFQGVQAQNYHIYTPNKDKSFALSGGVSHG